MQIEETIRILSLVAYHPDPSNRVYVDQDEAAKVVLKEYKLLKMRVEKMLEAMRINGAAGCPSQVGLNDCTVSCLEISCVTRWRQALGSIEV